MASLTKEQALGLLLWVRRRNKKKTNRIDKRQRRWWVHPILQRRKAQGEYHRLVQEMKLQRTDYFQAYFRMSVKQFGTLLDLVGPLITKQTTNCRQPISSGERLAVTLRFLATGDSYRTIASSYRMGISTVSSIIPEMCSAIWLALGPFLKCPSNASEWTAIADGFQSRWQFPHCLGALDGKHVAIQAPRNAGSLYFNYKKTHSIVLLAVVDASYRFLMVDVGAYGRSSDGGIFSESCFGRRLQNGTLGLPPPSSLEMDGPLIPYAFIADEAFPLKKNIMRPYSGSGLSRERRIFNYRLSRARRMVESTFGILANQWRVYHRAIPLLPQNVDQVIKATCSLHNFLRRNGADQGVASQQSSDSVSDPSPFHDLSGTGGRYTDEARAARDAFAAHFVGVGAVGWQDSSI